MSSNPSTASAVGLCHKAYKYDCVTQSPDSWKSQQRVQEPDVKPQPTELGAFKQGDMAIPLTLCAASLTHE